MSTHRFPELMTRAYAAGQKDERGKVRVVFVVDLDADSTNVDADWSTAHGAMVGEGRSGEQAFAALVARMEADHG